MTLRVVYRSTGSENPKSRPPYYSKLTCLASFLRAVERLGERPEIVFLNDGEIPPERLDLMLRFGEPMQVADVPEIVPERHLTQTTTGSLGLTRSLLASLALPDSRGWADGDVVYFVEDDYLHRPEALVRLRDGAEGVTDASYLTLYGTFHPTRRDAYRLPGGDWYTAESATSTFAARLGALRADRWIHVLACFTGSTADRDICFAYRGVRPFQWNHVVGDFLGYAPGGSGRFGGRLKRAAVQTALNSLAMKSGFARHVLVAPEPALATHMENDALAPGVDWERVAKDASTWLFESGDSVEGSTVSA